MASTFIKNDEGKIEFSQKDTKAFLGIIEHTLPYRNFPFIGIEQPEMSMRLKIRELIMKNACQMPFELIAESYYDGNIAITLQSGRAYSPLSHQLYIYNQQNYFQIHAQVMLDHFQLYKWKKAIEDNGGYYLLTLYENGRPLLERLKIIKNKINILHVANKKQWSYWS